MSKVTETIQAEHPIDAVITATRKLSKTFSSVLESDRCFEIKVNEAWDQMHCTVKVELIPNANLTQIIITASSYGMGPFVKKNNEKKLGTVKAALLSELNELKNKPLTQTVSNADELLKLKQLVDSGVITQSEFENEKKKLLGI